jgi:hypothetical protein
MDEEEQVSCQADFEIINMGNANLRAAMPDLTYKTYRRILKANHGIQLLMFKHYSILERNISLDNHH